MTVRELVALLVKENQDDTMLIQDGTAFAGSDLTGTFYEDAELESVRKGKKSVILSTF